MSARIETLKNRLAESRAVLDGVLDQVNGRWDTQVYADGAAWNVGQLVIHLSLSDKGLNNQAISFAEDREAIPADFDNERYNKRSVEKNAEISPDQARANLAESRLALIAWLDQLEDESVLDKVGRTAQLDFLTSEQVVLRLADHEEIHARDIAHVLGLAV